MNQKPDAENPAADRDGPSELSCISRLARIVSAAAFAASGDVYSVEELAMLVGLETRTLQHRCQAAHTTARACLGLTRCLRLVLNSRSKGWRPYEDLWNVDPRAQRRLVGTAGFDGAYRPSVEEFVQRQAFVSTDSFRVALLEAVRRAAAEDTTSK